MDTDKGTLKAWRLEAQKMGSQRWGSPERVVEWLGGVQAQEYQWARWSIGLRTDDCSDEDVERAIQNRKIVRTWMYRGTLHFVGGGDLQWLTSLLAPGIIRRNARRYRELALDDAAFVQSQRVIQRVLEAYSPLSRSEIVTHLEKESIPAQGQQAPYLLQRAALDGLICHGPQRGHEPTYVLVSEWVGEQHPLDPTEALARLATRYFASHGPATGQDLAWWAGLTARQVRLAVDTAPAIAPITVDGVEYWATGDPPSSGVTESGHLLARFDEYLLGYRDRSLVLDSTHARRVNAGGGMPKPTVVVNGEIVGAWRYEKRKQDAVVSVQPFRDLVSRERDLVDRAAGRLGDFMSKKLPVRYIPGEEKTE